MLTGMRETSMWKSTAESILALASPMTGHLVSFSSMRMVGSEMVGRKHLGLLGVFDQRLTARGS